MGRTRAPALLIGPLLTNRCHRCRTDAHPARVPAGPTRPSPRGHFKLTLRSARRWLLVPVPVIGAPLALLEHWDRLGGKSIALHFRSSQCPVSCLASQCCGARRYPKRWRLSGRPRHSWAASERLWFRRRSAGVVGSARPGREFVDEVAGGGGMVVAVFSPLTVMQTGGLAVGGMPKRPTSSRRWRAGCS
jgi:hypothetical protein